MASATEANAPNSALHHRATNNVVSLAATPRPAPAPAHMETTPLAKSKTVAICDTQPVTAEGIRNLLTASGDLQFTATVASLNQARELARLHAPDVLVVDKAFGIQAILDFFHESIQLARARTNVVIWGVSVTEAEALRFLQAGARGILRKTAAVPAVLACLRTVADGRTWMEDSVFREGLRGDRYPRTELTTREQQVLDLCGARL